MLETPPHAPFLTTPIPPSNNPGSSIVPGGNHRNRNARQQHQIPTEGTAPANHAHIQSQTSNRTPGSETGREHSLLEPTLQDEADAKDLVGLRDISSLATWTLSSSKPGCALAQLRHPSPAFFWQSDGPQPHTLTLHFFKLVAIVKMRVYLDFELDESYTATKMKFFAGMSESALVEFGAWEVQEHTDPETGEVHSGVEGIRGWIDIDLKGVGGKNPRHDKGRNGIFDKPKGIKARQTHEYGVLELDNEIVEATGLVGGDVLKAMVVQVRICENHQNGKDTHVRGFQVFARDDSNAQEVPRRRQEPKDWDEGGEGLGEKKQVYDRLEPASWMREPEIR